jgi:lipopolysaccharide biosynthesis glycosyltransferase
MKPIMFTVAGDEVNLGYAHKMINSFKKFHPDIETRIFGEDFVRQMNDPAFYYRATPMIADLLFNDGYDMILKIDADSIVTGDLNHIFEDETFDFGAVYNSNPREMAKLRVDVWDINPRIYLNCGFVAMRSHDFVRHWLKLCLSPHFNSYAYREQDLMNIIAYYGQYSFKPFDFGNRFHGLASSSYWHHFTIEGDQIYLDPVDDYPNKRKEIKVIHWAGGNVPNKLNVDATFKGTVKDRLNYLIGDNNGKSKEK